MKTATATTSAYTLIEILIVLLFMLILLLCSDASYLYLIQRNALQKTKNTIVSTIDYARLLSLSTQKPLMLTGVEGDWAKGIWLCAYQPSQYCTAASLMLERRFKNMKLGLEWHGFQSNHYLVFNASPLEMAVNGYFLLKFNELECKLVVNRLGTIREVMC